MIIPELSKEAFRDFCHLEYHPGLKVELQQFNLHLPLDQHRILALNIISYSHITYEKNFSFDMYGMIFVMETISDMTREHFVSSNNNLCQITPHITDVRMPLSHVGLEFHSILRQH